MDAIVAGDGSLGEGIFSLAFCDFTSSELDWFINILARPRWRDGTGAVVHGAFPVARKKK